MRSRLPLLTAGFCALVSGQAGAEAPMNAIDWLGTPAALPVVRVAPAPEAAPDEPAVARSAVLPAIETRPLGDDANAREATGLLPSHVTGLPRWLWQASDGAVLAGLVAAQRVEKHPAMQALLFTLLLAEADPPADARGEDVLLLARLDKLMELGAVEAAQALLERAGPQTPALFKRYFDATLLTGTEDAACALLADDPGLAQDYATRIFCLARGDDMEAADLTLGTAHTLGKLSPDEAELLARFLDPELAESLEPMPRPDHPSPLEFRMFEAIGETLSTRRLPRAFAMADLRNTSGWKAELEAAERLARSGAIPENRLLGIYTARMPAASGGIWDRVEAVQRFDRAMKTQDPGGIAKALGPAWSAMRDARLDVPFARLYAKDLIGLPLTGNAARLAFEIALLSPDYEAAALAATPTDAHMRFLVALARGIPAEAPSTDPLHGAITAGFDGGDPEPAMLALLEQRKLGEALLRTVRDLTEVTQVDHDDIAQALRLLRHVGLEDSARRAALDLLLRTPA